MSRTKYLKTTDGGVFYYRRRVPADVLDIVGKTNINISLKTKDKETAEKKAGILSSQLESTWDDFRVNGGSESDKKYKRAIRIAKVSGFQYMPVEDIARAGPGEIVDRLRTIQKDKAVKSAVKVGALLGGEKVPQMRLSECFERFREIIRPTLINKSENQRKKWFQPREAAMQRLINLVGDLEVTDLKRDHILQLREMLLEKIEDGEIVSHTLNRYIQRIRKAITVVNEEDNLEINPDEIFKKISIPENENTRIAFPVSFVRDVLMDMRNFEGLHLHARLMIPIMANTGISPSEYCSLDRKLIILDADIPYIDIRSKNRELKTKQRARTIPLVGAALWAFKQIPEGPTHYFDRNDSLSGNIGKFLIEHNLKPTEEHKLYSLRHTYQDLLRINHVDERIQCELMGHKYDRQKYGAPSLEEKHRAISKFAFHIKN